MLYIKKTPPSLEVMREIAKLKSSPEWRALSEENTEGIRSTFDLLPKDVIRAPLLKDQHYLCAYCMRRIRNDSNTSIEHFKPLSLGKEHALEYNNFLVVCDGGENSDIHNRRRILCCDASKGDLELNYLNPMDPTCMSGITYTNQGSIGYRYPSDWTDDQKDAVNKDINKILKLNGKIDKDNLTIQDTATGLVTNRKAAYDTYKNIVSRWAQKNKLTKAQIQKTIQQLLDKQERDEYVGVVIYFLARKARQLNS